MPRLLGRVALVTGSSSGLGRAIARRFASEGARVVCADLGPQARVPNLPPSSQSLSGDNRKTEENEDGDDNYPTHELIQRNGGQACFVACNVAEEEQVRNAIQEAVRQYGKLEVLVNNAGVALEATKPGMLHETSVETWDATMSVNARGVFLCCKYALEQMLQQDLSEAGFRGCIINLSSIYGLVGGYDNPSYSASKAAVANLTRQAALDYGPLGIRVNALNPGHIQTAIFEETRANMVSEDKLKTWYPLAGGSSDGDLGIGGRLGHYTGPGVKGGREGRLGKPSDVAGAAVWLASDDATWVTGICLPVDGGYTAR